MLNGLSAHGRFFALSLGLLCIIAAVPGTSRAAKADCLSWPEARRIVESGRAIPLQQVKRRLLDRISGKLISADLCKRGGGLVYKVVVLGPRGRVVNVSIDARTGQTLLSQRPDNRGAPNPGRRVRRGLHRR